MNIITPPSQDANSYVSVDYFESFCAARGILPSVDSSILLINAMDYLSTLRWMGKKSDPSQPLSFPRCGLLLDREKVDSNSVPSNIKLAQCWLAVYSEEMELMPVNEQSRVVSETISVISVSYSDKGDDDTFSPSYPIVDGLICDFVDSSRKYAINARIVK